MSTPNTLTGLIPDVYAALAIVSRELVGLIPACTSDAALARAAVNENITWPIAPAASASDITPAVTPPDDGNQTIGKASIAITKSRRVPFRWNGEEIRGLSFGSGVLTIQQQQIAQAIRTLTNEIESDLAGMHKNFSRATGTAGTTPFASTLNSTADLKKMLDDNGAPASDRHLIIDTSAGANLRKLSNLYKVNEAGTQDVLTQGKLINLNNFDIRESAQVKQAVTVGTASGATTNNAGYAVGTTTLTLAAVGTGTLIAGDVITFAGDTNQYVVTSGDADVSNGGTITIGAPGLRVAMSAATKAITVVAAAARNMAFHRSSLLLAQRLPLLPDGGDMARDRTTIQDPVSGLVFEIAQYPQYRQMQWEISCAWGVGTANEQHTALLLG